MEKKTLPRLETNAQSPPFRIVFIYALFGALWILLSDKLLGLMIHDRAAITRISMYKGWMFIAITAWLLYRLISRDYRKLRDAGELIRKNEELLRNVLETMPVGVWIVDQAGRIQQGNKAGESIWCGTTMAGPDQYDQYKGWWADTGRRIEAHEWGAVRAIQRGETSLNEVVDIECFDGTRKTILHSAVPLRDAGLRLIGAIVLNEDITERRRMENDLLESRERYRSLFENTPAVVLLIDPDTADIVDANAAAVSFYGYAREELVRMKTTGISILSEEQVLNNLTEAMKVPQHVERRHRLKSGEARDVEVYRGPISIENRVYLFAIIHDITDRKKAEELLRDSENMLRAITDAAADSIILIDDEMRVTYWNSAAERMFGYSRKEVMGEHIHFIVPDRYRQAHDAGFRSFVATGEGDLIGRTYEVSALKKGGVEFPVELAISAVRLMGKWHAAGIIRDISERKDLEKQIRHAQKMEAIGTFTGGIAHDFNNSLTAIIGFGSLFRMKLPKDDPLVSHVDNILAAADRAAELIRSLLTFSRYQPIEVKPVDLNEVVRSAEKLLTRLLREDIDLRIELPEEPVVVLADAGQILQILMNLAANAEDAMPHGGMVTLRTSRDTMEVDTIKLHGDQRPGTYALLSFSDTGIGMDDETRQRIFEPFFTTKGLGKGTGLGLSSVYGIVKQHDGFINCCSEPGRGTAFRIYLPVTITEAVQTTASVRPAAPRGTETILVAEDDVMVRGLVSDLLGQFGYTVVEAIDGEDAVVKFRDQMDSIQLLLLDVIMPKKNGRQVYEEIRSIKPGIRVIFTSGYPAEVFNGADSLAEGFTFISKPVSPSALLLKIREVLEG
jgi:two-component system cell cycle sensor histidine kinase/response regulator CckA